MGAEIWSAADAQRILDNLRLAMEVRGSKFHLKNEQLRSWSGGDSGWIDITINMPRKIDLEVDDGSGPISISGMGRSIRIEDGSGEIRVRNARRDVDIEDGAGSSTTPALRGRWTSRSEKGKRQAGLPASLDHHNIGPIHLLEEAEGKRFLVLEACAG